jgi:hypothetical protein
MPGTPFILLIRSGNRFLVQVETHAQLIDQLALFDILTDTA